MQALKTERAECDQNTATAGCSTRRCVQSSALTTGENPPVALTQPQVLIRTSNKHTNGICGRVDVIPRNENTSVTFHVACG
jgi:hypothetical protein